MSKYDRYKASGIEWMGNIPEPWLLKRTKHFYSSSMGETILNEDLIDDALIPVYSATESDTIFGYVEKASVILEAGDIIIPARGNSIGNIKLVDKKCTCTQTTIYSKQISKRVLPNFIFYYYSGLKGYLFQFDNTAIPQITVRQVSNNPIVLPTYDEQLSIANYLDDQTQKIDRLIANKKAQAEKLKELRQIEINNAVTKGLNPNAEMKDSGIEWLGNIPKHWEVKRVKNIGSIINGSTPSSSVDSYWDGDIIWVTPGDFKNFDYSIDNSENKITTEGYKNCGTSLVPIGSLILTTRAPIGNVLLAAKELCTNQGCKSIVPVKINSEFLYYYFSTSSIQLNVLGQGTTFLELSTTNLGTFKVPVPPREEQIEIASYLNQRTTAIDQLIKNIEAQIEKLQELRKIKIYEAVTGKIKVNAYAETTA